MPSPLSFAIYKHDEMCDDDDDCLAANSVPRWDLLVGMEVQQILSAAAFWKPPSSSKEIHPVVRGIPDGAGPSTHVLVSHALPQLCWVVILMTPGRKTKEEKSTTEPEKRLGVSVWVDMKAKYSGTRTMYPGSCPGKVCSPAVPSSSPDTRNKLNSWDGFSACRSAHPLVSGGPWERSSLEDSRDRQTTKRTGWACLLSKIVQDG